MGNFNRPFNRENSTGPCMHCADRSVGCHGVCKDYNDWKAKRIEAKRQLRRSLPPKLYNSDFDPPGCKGREIKR